MVSRQSVARVGDTIARIVRALHQIAVERGDITRSSTQDATHRERVRCGVVVRLRQIVLLHVAGRGHHRVAGRVVCFRRGNVGQVLVVQYEVAERRTHAHDNLFEEGDNLIDLRIREPLAFVHLLVASLSGLQLTPVGYP